MKKRKSSPVRTIWVRTFTARYPVRVAPGLLQQVSEHVRELRPQCRRLFVVSSPRVWRLWGGELTRGIRAGRLGLETLLVDDREEKKRLATVERVANGLLARGADRGAVLAALGGGVVGDVTGFVAATYMRGVGLLQIPTTLVGQIDSAIGGKTGVNLQAGKNLVGAFHQPLAVLVDPRALESLPAREFRAGLYEVVKCAVIGDAALFQFLEQHLGAVLEREESAMRRVLAGAIRFKARIVSRDERETGLRRVLNFGHTIGHALETLSGYHGLRHGEAVGWGMIGATRLAVRVRRLAPRDAERIIGLVHALGRLPPLPRIPPGRIYGQLFADKKKQDSALCFVLPRRVGRVDVISGIPRSTVLAALRELNAPRATR